MGRLRELLTTDSPDMNEIEAHLDGLSSSERVEEIRSLGRKHQAKLFDAAEGYRAISVDDIVGPERAPMEEVVHHGKNTLPAFSHFAKVFVRPPEPNAAVVWGHNRAGPFIESVVGPGYFVAYPHSVPGEILVDYLQVPPARPEHWPDILPNSARLSRVVYDGMQDVLRGVSRHVTIGRATKGGKPMSSWFVLCRDSDS